MIRHHDDPRYPRSCEQCAEWSETRVRNWHRDERCVPRCWRQSFGEFAYRMFGVWAMIGRGEIVDQEGTTHWSIEWPALQLVLETEHPALGDTEPTEVVDAMLLIRNDLNRDQGPALTPVDADE